jgi:plastocyanin domain-containing protein
MKILNLLLASTFVLAACGGDEQHMAAEQNHTMMGAESAARAGEVRATAGADGVQEATVHVGGTYSPEIIRVKAGQPVRLNFHRADDLNCGQELVVNDLGVKKELPIGQTVPVEFTPRKEGEIAFTCGMDMMRGKIVVE